MQDSAINYVKKSEPLSIWNSNIEAYLLENNALKRLQILNGQLAVWLKYYYIKRQNLEGVKATKKKTYVQCSKILNMNKLCSIHVKVLIMI